MENEKLLELTRDVDFSIDGSEPQFLEESSQLQAAQNKHHSLRRIARKNLPWIVHILLLAASLSALINAILIRQSLPANCMEARRSWAIIMGSIPEEIHFERSRGGFNRSLSPFKGPPSPEVDAAWRKLTEYGVMSIPEETFEKLNVSKHSVKVPEDRGGGRLAYSEVIHLLHCVQSLWRNTYPDYYFDSAEDLGITDQDWHEHMDHCADMLRQKIMCESDPTLLTYNWLKGHEHPHPNFGSARKCRDFDVVIQYALDHTLPGGFLVKPKDGSVMEYEDLPSDPDDEGSPSQ